MAAAATLTDAVTLAQFNLQAKNTSVGGLKVALAAYNAAWPTTLSEQSEDNRTVLDWLVLLQEQTDDMSTGIGASQRQIETAGDVLDRQLLATSRAQTAGRISSAQATAILAAYNAQLA